MSAADPVSGISLSLKSEYSGVISAHCNLRFLGSKTGFHHIAQAGLERLSSGNPPALAFQSARIIDMSHHSKLLSFFQKAQLERGRGFHRVGQAGLKLLISSDLPALASQSAGITGVSHHAQLRHIFRVMLGTNKAKRGGSAVGDQVLTTLALTSTDPDPPATEFTLPPPGTDPKPDRCWLPMSPERILCQAGFPTQLNLSGNPKKGVLEP
ncbi:hypothetical protein AAY473_014475 [Plecturocebus cupreus]